MGDRKQPTPPPTDQIKPAPPPAPPDRIRDFLTRSDVLLPMLFQRRVRAWVLDCFGEVIANDSVERSFRFVEEALELAQANNCTAEQAHKLVDYVFGRPAGEKDQEVGGVMVTLAALCSAADIDMMAAANREIDRVERPEVKTRIRAKQAAKRAVASHAAAAALPGEWANPSPPASDVGGLERKGL